MKLYKPIYSGRKPSKLSNVELLVSYLFVSYLLVSYLVVSYLLVSYLLVSCLVALVSCLNHVHASASCLTCLIKQV